MQLAVAPVFLISAIGVILGSMTVRYGRVIDRMRAVLHDLSGGPLPSGHNADDIHEELRGLYQRARLLRTTIIFAALSIFFVALTIFILFSELLLETHFFYMPELTFSLSLVMLIIALGMFINDFAISLRFFKIEVRARLGAKYRL